MTSTRSREPHTGGRGVLITGASRGVGAAAARVFAEAGDRVVVHYRGAEERAREVLASLPGEGHSLLRADLTSPEETRELAARAIVALGRIDVLVNNAALFLDPAGEGSRRGDHRITDVDYEDWVRAWRTTLETNLLGPANLTWCVARHMMEVPAAEGAPAGRVVNVGSRGAYRGEPDVPAYGASKAGLHAFGQSMAVALAPHGIGVVSIAPGFIATDMAAQVLDGPGGDAVRAQSPFGRVAEADEVARAIWALSRPEAQWASGSVVDFNGASYLR
ncbi:SDR family NAD(P)-dependent oxidoreductase [Ornithinimicrobium panacihumi]|uniref:SDR family NAD(P)-dependent oxidoreductase n=1 Tax=Ornithinimicrobium panacihumi TaxID=2008449 RepID=UPI003F89437B